jgi:ParB family chromosome partitioning protein
MKDRQIQEVPVDELVCLPQVRKSTGFSEAEIAGLAQSISEAGGVIQPLLVRREGARLIILDGERRWRAAKKAGRQTVPVIVEEEELDGKGVLYLQLVLDAQRVELSPMERARAIRRLMNETGWPAKDVAVKLGISSASVSKLLALTVLPETVQKAVADGRLAMSTAYELAKIDDASRLEAFSKEALEGRLTRDALVQRTRETANAASPPKRRRAPRAPRERVVIAFGDGGFISVSGPCLSVEGVLGWFAEASARIRNAAVDGRSLAEVVKSVSGPQR